MRAPQLTHVATTKPSRRELGAGRLLRLFLGGEGGADQDGERQPQDRGRGGRPEGAGSTRAAATGGGSGGLGGGDRQGPQASRAAIRRLLRRISGGGLRVPVRWLALTGVLMGSAAILILVSRPSAPVVAAVAILLGGVCALLGWLIGERRRVGLEGEIESRTSDLKRALSELEIAQAETVRRLSMAVEFRDEDTGAHIERIGRFSALLASQLGMSPEFCERISHAAPLHDVGKVAIPDAILLKPGPLTEQERAIVETHTEEGHRLLRGSSSSILDLAASIALSHHEKWDGGGYPRGLSGQDIPIEGRIVAIADVFDALTSDRVYRLAFSVQEAVAMMVAQRGKHFDPTMLDAFLEVLGNTGPTARARPDATPSELVGEVFERYLAAIERGDAETAEGVIAQAIEDQIPPSMLHEEVIGASMRRIGELWEQREIDSGSRQLATGISRRILATMHRYMLRHAEPDREKVLVAGIEDDDHMLSLQMVHDQLAAAGFQARIDLDLGLEQLQETIESESPEIIVLGASVSPAGQTVERIVKHLRESHPSIPVLLGGSAIPPRLRRRDDVRFLSRVDEAVPAVEQMLAAR